MFIKSLFTMSSLTLTLGLSCITTTTQAAVSIGQMDGVISGIESVDGGSDGVTCHLVPSGDSCHCPKDKVVLYSCVNTGRFVMQPCARARGDPPGNAMM